MHVELIHPIAMDGVVDVQEHGGVWYEGRSLASQASLPLGENLQGVVVEVD
jgi:hypothetical protein